MPGRRTAVSENTALPKNDRPGTSHTILEIAQERDDIVVVQIHAQPPEIGELELAVGQVDSNVTFRDFDVGCVPRVLSRSLHHRNAGIDSEDTSVPIGEECRPGARATPRVEDGA